MPGARSRWRPRMAWMDKIKTRTGLSVEESIRMTEDRDKWRKCVHGVANPNRYKNSFMLFRLIHLQWCDMVHAWFSCMLVYSSISRLPKSNKRFVRDASPAYIRRHLHSPRVRIVLLDVEGNERNVLAETSNSSRTCSCTVDLHDISRRLRLSLALFALFYLCIILSGLTLQAVNGIDWLVTPAFDVVHETVYEMQ